MSVIFLDLFMQGLQTHSTIPDETRELTQEAGNVRGVLILAHHELDFNLPALDDKDLRCPNLSLLLAQRAIPEAEPDGLARAINDVLENDSDTLNKHDDADVEVLVPDANQRIIGFFGGSNEDGWQSIHEFGIVTAPKDHPVPDAVYDMPELQNNSDRGAGRSHKRRKIDEDTSEDEDTGYDSDSDNSDLDD
ncbi:hypothetical protein BKA56DRAFT_678187 [Ilyonectria sp. MPI-CAGE-AT-0026]|nr:hypothetical protein BKA56DRAFT_678187 [Ilyonectria sp. MPI-CAGE-AT-0026]